MRRRLGIALLSVAVFVLLGTILLFGVTADAPQLTLANGLGNGDQAPEIVGVDLDGNSLALSDFRGKVVLLDFFGDW